jgi:hypothetical protein
LMFACEHPSVEVDLPAEPERLVVNCYAAADSVFDVRVWGSMETFSTDTPKVIDNATLVVSDGVNEFPLFFESEYLTYRSEVVAEAGKQYTLKVSAPGYGEAQSTVRVPVPVRVLEVQSFVTPDPTDPGTQRRNFDIVFEDPGNEENYYAVAMFSSHYHPHPPYEKWLWLPVQRESADPGRYLEEVLFQESFYQYKSPIGMPTLNVLFNDRLFNGKTHTYRFMCRENRNPQTVENQNRLEYQIYFKTITEEYYNYRITYNQQHRAMEDPFSSPVQVFNNIENGYGIFAAFSESFVLYKVR